MLVNKVIHVCVGIILYGESEYALETLAALKQQDFDEGTNLSLVVVDNGIPEALKEQILNQYHGQILYLKNFDNFGFSAAANQCLSEALNYNADFLLLLNPDLLLDTVAVRELLKSAARNENADFFTPKLMRANQDLSPTEPAVFDACGMIIEKSIRHLDRGSGQLDQGQYQTEEPVFGGTGACLLIRLSRILKICIPRNKYESDLFQIYPQLQQGADRRLQLFDESFFAYREDGDLAWRSQLLGSSCIYCPLAVGHHVRRVLPENRSELPAVINLFSVRNRFLLQVNNLRLFSSLEIFVKGFVIRNLLVIAAVLFRERTSIKAFRDLWILRKRAIANRKFIFKNSTEEKIRATIKWFKT